MTSMLSRLPRLVSIKEVATQLNVSTKTVRRLIASGELHVHRLGRQIRIAEDDLTVFLAKRRC